MRNPEYKIVVSDVSSKVTNPREELMKEKESKIRKPFIFKGYKSEADRIKDVVYNNRLLYNLPDYPDTQRERLHKEKSSNNTNNIIYNFNINAPKRFNTVNSNDDMHSLIRINDRMLSYKKNDGTNTSDNNTKTSFLNYKNNYNSLRKYEIYSKN